MELNLGSLDRAARILLGTAVILIGHYYQSYFGFLGFLIILTGVVGFCPAYCPLKLKTKK